jgi:hypothetical protein
MVGVFELPRVVVERVVDVALEEDLVWLRGI